MDFIIQNSSIIVFAVVIFIWVAAFYYLVSIEKKISKLEKNN